MKKVEIIVDVIGVILLIALFVWMFSLKTFGSAEINGINAHGMTQEELNKAHEKYNDVTLQIGGKSVKTKLTYTYMGKNRRDLVFSNIPFVKIKGNRNFWVSGSSKEAIESSVEKFDKSPKNAKIDKKTLEVIKEEDGVSLDCEKIDEKIRNSKLNDLKKTTYTININDYKTHPKVTEKDLKAKSEYMKSHIKGGIKINFGDISYYLTQDELFDMVKDESINKKKLKKAIQSKMSYVRPSVLRIKTLNGKKKLNNYAVTYKVHIDNTTDKVKNALENGEKSVEGEYTEGATSTRVEVNLGAQTVNYVKNNKSVMSCSCVTGTAGHRTPTGIYSISYKARNVTLRGRNDDGSKYASPVSYWMPFNGGIGLHDATWRGSFGGSIYMYNGSHGCVNMPYAKAAELYGMVDAGTLVYVY